MKSKISNSKQNKNLHWLITGGCGFIGRNLILYLKENDPNINIRILDNLSIGSKKDLSSVTDYFERELSLIKDHPQGVELVIGDIRDFNVCLKACGGVSTIVHLAANTGVAPSVEEPRQDMEANVIGTFNMLEAARQHGVKKYIFASSGAPIGECDSPIYEDLAPHPASPYGASKLAGEGYCSAYFHAFGIETVALRFGNVYGPGSGHKNSVVAKFIRQAMRGETLEIYGDGKQTRDFVYIDDLIYAIRLAAKVDGIGGETFQIATNSETTVHELAYSLISIFADSGFKGVEVCHMAPRPGDVRRNFSETSKARQMLGWQAQVDLSTGLTRTVEWFTNLN